MKITLVIGALLALCHFIFNVLPLDMFSGYNQYVAASYPHNLITGWMSGSPSVENEIYKTICYILAVMPYGASYYQDFKSGIIKNIYVRENKKKFLLSKSIAVFLSGGIAVVFPLIFSLILCATVLPVIVPQWSLGPHPDGMFVSFYYNNILLYFTMRFVVIFVYGGLIAGLSLSISLFAKNIFIVLTSPFIICTLINKLTVYGNSEMIWGLKIARIFDMMQAGASYPAGMLLLAVIIFVLGYCLFIVRGVHNETY